MTTAPYGTWPSPVTAAMLAASSNRLSEVRLHEGQAYWLEGRPAEAGRVVLMRGDPFDDAVDVTPAGFSCRTTVHEYGGGAYALHGGTVVFSNFDDQRLYRQAGNGSPVAITPESQGTHRFADGVFTPDGEHWIGIRERHDLGDRVDDVVNEIVAVPVDGSTEARVIVTGRDFYAGPRIAPQGDRVSFLSWNHPWMPWDGCELSVADLGPGATVGEAGVVAGRDGRESIWQPEWSPTGDLVFASDRSGWWNLERIRDGDRTTLHTAEAEFGFPQWVFGSRSFGFLEDGRIACQYGVGGWTRVGVLDPETGELLDLDVPYDALEFGPTLAADGQTICFGAGSARAPKQIVWLDFSARSVEVLRSAAEIDVDDGFVSAPEAIEFPTEGGLTAHGFFYGPWNPGMEGPPNERPPLMVMSHGGPTGATTPILDVEVQFLTSRGFAVVDVNYGGSTGYGRDYRRRLEGRWGVVDLQDCVAAARYLADRDRVDGDRLLIRGGSAGGYTTLRALTEEPALFAAGANYYGVADLEAFATGGTHKFESRYLDSLVGPWPAAAETYRERSPINHVDRLRTPTLVLQGADDHVVPPAQSEVIVDALRAKRIPHAYRLFEGEGHGFRRAENIVASAEAELSFYAQILGLERDDVPRLDIEHLSAPAG